MFETSKLSNLHSSNKPRERLLNFGSKALSNSELLAIILRSGGASKSVLDLSNDLLKTYGGFKGLLHADVIELMSIKNLGMAKATTLKAVFEIVGRLLAEENEKKMKIQSPADVFRLMVPYLRNESKENLYVLCVDTQNVVIAKELVSIGTTNETLVHPREVFRIAYLKNATSIVLVHNHPSGSIEPSAEDVVITNRIYEAGVLLGVGLKDHVIVGRNDYFSFKVKNLIERR